MSDRGMPTPEEERESIEERMRLAERVFDADYLDVEEAE